MSIPATEGVAPATGFYQPSTTAPGTSEDKEMFLNLLVAQLRYQDPMNPADSGEFLAQSAQFTALEKMQDVADQTAGLLAAQVSFGATGLVGRYVSYLDEKGDSHTGQVGSVTYDQSGPMLVVDGEPVSLGQVETVSATPIEPEAPEPTNTDTPTNAPTP
ncbi:MAG TPA: flagellar hook capping FlgD N-terminal domain-containing protein [Nocardioides sp.]|nr:flagellar hook capping FlgD N-terminal domain-containing protein [Nocardioides sp.]